MVKIRKRNIDFSFTIFENYQVQNYTYTHKVLEKKIPFYEFYARKFLFAHFEFQSMHFDIINDSRLQEFRENCARKFKSSFSTFFLFLFCSMKIYANEI